MASDPALTSCIFAGLFSLTPDPDAHSFIIYSSSSLLSFTRIPSLVEDKGSLPGGVPDTGVLLILSADRTADSLLQWMIEN